MQFCTASIWERHLLNSVLSVESQFYKNMRCGDLVLKQTFQLLDQLLLCYKAVPTRNLQSVSSFSSNDFTCWSPSGPQKMPNFSGQLSTTVPIMYTLCRYCHLIESWGLFTSARATRILPAASIREHDYFVQHIWRCGDNSRAATNRERRLIEQIQYDS